MKPPGIGLWERYRCAECQQWVFWGLPRSGNERDARLYEWPQDWREHRCQATVTAAELRRAIAPFPEFWPERRRVVTRVPEPPREPTPVWERET